VAAVKKVPVQLLQQLWEVQEKDAEAVAMKAQKWVESLEEDAEVNTALLLLLQQQMLATCLQTLALVLKRLLIKQKKVFHGHSIKFSLGR
jgi:hypothetical protein